MRVTCREVAQLLVDFVEGDLPEMRMITVQQHICACLPCMFYLDSYRTTIESTHALPREPLPPEFDARLRSVLQQWNTQSGSEPARET
jgi:hypothetical protein